MGTCSTPASVRLTSFTGEFNGPFDLPPGTMTDAIIERVIGTTERNRQQVILDFGCARKGSNIVPDLIDYETAHWLKLQMMLEGMPGDNPNPNLPPPLGPIKYGQWDRDGTVSKIERAVGNVEPENLLGDDNFGTTFYGQRWYSLWESLPHEVQSSFKAGVSQKSLPIFSYYSWVY